MSKNVIAAIVLGMITTGTVIAMVMSAFTAQFWWNVFWFTSASISTVAFVLQLEKCWEEE